MTADQARDIKNTSENQKALCELFIGLEIKAAARLHGRIPTQVPQALVSAYFGAAGAILNRQLAQQFGEEVKLIEPVFGSAFTLHFRLWDDDPETGESLRHLGEWEIDTPVVLPADADALEFSDARILGHVVLRQSFEKSTPTRPPSLSEYMSGIARMKGRGPRQSYCDRVEQGEFLRMSAACVAAILLAEQEALNAMAKERERIRRLELPKEEQARLEAEDTANRDKDLRTITANLRNWHIELAERWSKSGMTAPAIAARLPGVKESTVEGWLESSQH